MLVSYLQRFCARNETASFFGPLNYGRLDPDRPRDLEVRRSPRQLRRRETFLAHWAVEQLAGRSRCRSKPVRPPRALERHLASIPRPRMAASPLSAGAREDSAKRRLPDWWVISLDRSVSDPSRR